MIIVAPEPGDVVTLRKVGNGDKKRVVKFRIKEIDSENKEYIVEHIGVEGALKCDETDTEEERAKFSKLSKVVQEAGDIKITKGGSLLQ